jgi:large subunit ribosomal protein L33
LSDSPGPIDRSGQESRSKSPDQRVQIKSWFNRPGKPFRKAARATGKKRLEIIHLVCQETGDQNYTLRRKSGGEKLKLKKYSPRLRRHTVHVEKKK